MLDKKKFYLISEAADFFPFLTDRKIHRQKTIWLWIKTGKIKAIKAGGFFRISGEEIAKLLGNVK